MKAIICAVALALVPTVAAAGDMHAFDYRGNGTPVALAAPSETRSAQGSVVEQALPSAMFLTRDSDYSKFMKANVPVDAHRQAMRLLWATNPELGRPTKEDTLAVGYVTEPIQTASLDGQKIAALSK